MYAKNIIININTSQDVRKCMLFDPNETNASKIKRLLSSEEITTSQNTQRRIILSNEEITTTQKCITSPHVENIYDEEVIYKVTGYPHENSMSLTSMPTSYIKILYGVSSNGTLHISKDRKYLLTKDNKLFNKLVNFNRGIFSMNSDEFKTLSPHLNGYVFNKQINVPQATSLLRFKEAFMYCNPDKVKNCVFYSGTALLLYGSTYTKDIDVVIYNMTHAEIQNEFGELFSKYDIDYCFNVRVSNGMNGVTEKYYDKNCNVHHNSNVLNSIGSSNYIMKNIVNLAGLNIFNPTILKQFYIERFDTQTHCAKALMLIDMYSMYKNNDFGRFHVSTSYSFRDLTKFRGYLSKYHSLNINDAASAIRLIAEFTDAQLCKTDLYST